MKFVIAAILPDLVMPSHAPPPDGWASRPERTGREEVGLDDDDDGDDNSGDGST